MDRRRYQPIDLNKLRAHVFSYGRALRPAMLQQSDPVANERDELVLLYQLLQKLHASMAKDMADLEALLATPSKKSSAEKLVRNSLQCSDPKLTHKESEVLNMFAKGYSYCEAAKLLDCKLATIQTHAKRIYKKLKVHSRSEAVFEARQLGLVQA